MSRLRLEINHEMLPNADEALLEWAHMLKSCLARGGSGAMPPGVALAKGVQNGNPGKKLPSDGRVAVQRDKLTATTSALDKLGEIKISADILSRLTQREIQVLELICWGLSNKAIAQKLRMSVGTVKAHVASIMQITRTDSRTKAALACRQLLPEKTY